MAEKIKDPVCGMEIEKDAAVGPVEHRGKIFYFCRQRCKQKFENDPAKYTKRTRVITNEINKNLYKRFYGQ